MIPLCKANPFPRAAMIQVRLVEGKLPRMPYDNRIFFVYEGEGNIFLNGSRIPIQRNTLIYLGIHDKYFFKGKLRAAVINFDMTMAFFDKKTPVCPVCEEEYDRSLVFDQTVVEGFTEPIVFSADEMIKNEITRLVDTFIRGGRYADSICSTICKEILISIREALDASKSNDLLLAQRLMIYIKENAVRIKDNEEIGKVFGYNACYLGSVFKKQMGKTLHAAMIEERLRFSTRMLIYTNNTIEQIAFESGFTSRNHYCTVFKKYFGISPLSYRNKRTVIPAV